MNTLPWWSPFLVVVCFVVLVGLFYLGKRVHQTQMARINKNAQIHLEESVFNGTLPDMNALIIRWVQRLTEFSELNTSITSVVDALNEAIPDNIPHFWFVKDTGVDLGKPLQLTLDVSEKGLEAGALKEHLLRYSSDVNALRTDLVLTLLARTANERLIGLDLYPILEIMFNLVHRVGGSIHEVYPVYDNGPLDGFALRTKHHVVYLTGIYPTGKEFQLKGIGA